MREGLLILLLLLAGRCAAFEGRITVSLTRGADVQTCLYSYGSNCLRIERGETNLPYSKNLVALDTGVVTILFPHNRSFVRLPDPATVNLPPTPTVPANLAAVPDAPLLPQSPPGIGPRPDTGTAAPAPPGTFPGGLTAMPAMPVPPTMQADFATTDITTNLFGYHCAKYQLKLGGQTMEIWATSQLPAFQPWLPGQPSRLGPRMLEEQWSAILKSKKLFPLLAISRFENGPEQFRFEVKTITPGKIEDQAGFFFVPPSDYHEIQPLSF